MSISCRDRYSIILLQQHRYDLMPSAVASKTQSGESNAWTFPDRALIRPNMENGKTYLSDYYTGAKLDDYSMCWIITRREPQRDVQKLSFAIDSFDAQDQVLLLELPTYLE